MKDGSPSPLEKLARRIVRRIRGRPAFGGWIDVATWVSDDVLLLLGWFDAPESGPIEAAVRRNDREVPLDLRAFSYARPDVTGAGPRPGKIALARLAGGGRPGGALGPLLLRHAGGAAWIGPRDLSEAIATTTNFGQRFAALEPEIRNGALEFLSEMGVSGFASRADPLLRRSLFLVREAIRESWPAGGGPSGGSPELVVDALLAMDDRQFCLQGWMRAGRSSITSLTVVSPEGERVDVLDRLFRVPRPDVEGRAAQTAGNAGPAGFRCAFELSTPNRLSEGWTVEMRDAGGTTLEAPVPPTLDEPLAVRGAILADLARERFPSVELMERHYFPVLGRLHERLDQPVEPSDVLAYGDLPETPGVSIVIPLYRRIDLLEQQLAQFTSDPEIRRAELIYVLDSPELADDLRAVAGDLFAIYGVPFRLAILPRNAGFATANNVGVSLARAPLLLLCNSDVVPNGAGWLGRMAAFYRATPGIGALGPKLLFEDDSLQHAGMYFRRTDEPGVWENLHYYKGLHRDTPAANVTRRVPAVTAACLMIDRELYRSVGGLRSMYVQGDYEDSDFCLRLAQAGYDSWYLADVELYHLEGQSYPGTVRRSASRYNRWLQSRLWGEEIERMMAGASLANSGAVRTDVTAAAASLPAIEILEVVPPPPESVASVQLHLDSPHPGTRTDRYRLDVAGWALGRDRRVKAVELHGGNGLFRRIPVDKPRPDVAATIADAAAAGPCGFRASISVLGLPPAFELVAFAVMEGDTRIPAGAVRGRRRLLPAPSASSMNPLIITSYGRSGSTYLARLLGTHPAIVTYAPFRLEPRIAGYWAQAFRTLSDPGSYLQSLATVLSSDQWWIGSDHLQPARAPDAPIQDWLERDSIESLADFCRQRVQEFYRRVAVLQERRSPAFFVEKNPPPTFSTRTLAFELFPGGREIFLVRDFRDMICSILAYNARTNRVGFGREKVGSDEEFVLRMRGAAQELLATWQERAGEALLVRYEDLILSPAETLERILAYLGLEGGSLVTTGMIQEAREAAGESERQHVTSPSVAGSIGRWRRDLDERMQEACRQAFGDLLPAFGYPESATADPPVARQHASHS